VADCAAVLAPYDGRLFPVEKRLQFKRLDSREWSISAKITLIQSDDPKFADRTQVTDAKRNSLFNDAFREHRGRLYHYLKRRLANEDDAQELAQEAFLRLLRVTRVDLVADPQAYLYRVARNLAYEQEAKRLPARSWAEDSELERVEDTRDTPEAEAERTVLAASIARVMSELSLRNRAILVLFCQNGLSQREISDQVGLSKSMVQKCLAQAIAHCRKRLQTMGKRNGSRQGARQ
jgi:RNA polymerase sigma-19 factor, ECF subfamily